MRVKPENAYLAELTSSFSPIYGQAISIRPMRPEDLDIETEFAQSLSAESRYNRLFSAGVSSLSPEWLRKLTCIDYTRDMALIATVMLEGVEVQIGVARYVLLDDGRTCEFALTVADAWQRRGIGRMLMLHLIEYAWARGLQTMVGDVLASNTPMLTLVRALGFTLASNPDGPELRRVSLSVAQKQPAVRRQVRAKAPQPKKRQTR